MEKGEQTVAAINGAAKYGRRTLLLLVVVVAAVAVIGGGYALTSRSSADDDFRAMHQKAVVAMRDENLSGNAAARPFGGRHVEVDCVLAVPMMGMFREMA